VPEKFKSRVFDPHITVYFLQQHPVGLCTCRAACSECQAPAGAHARVRVRSRAACSGCQAAAGLHALGVKPQQEHMPGFGCIVLPCDVAKNTPLYAGRKRNF
jgi:hypothetical protein